MLLDFEVAFDNLQFFETAFDNFEIASDNFSACKIRILPYLFEISFDK